MRNGRGVDDYHTSMNGRISFVGVKSPFPASNEENFRKGMHMLVGFVVRVELVAFVYAQLVIFNVIKFSRMNLKLSHVKYYNI